LSRGRKFMNLKITNKWALMVLVFVAAGALTANAQQVISLQKAVDLTLANNLTIKQAVITESLANEDVQQAKYNMLPNLIATPSGGYYFGKSQVQGAFAYATSTLNINGNAQANVTLFQGGQLRNQILENRLLLDIDKSATAKIKNDLILNVVTDYLTILTNQDLVVAAQQQIDIAKITEDRTQKSYDAGNMSLADLSQAKAGLSTAELNLTTAQNQLDLSVLVLKQYMEMDPATNIKVEKPDISKLTEIRTAYNANDVIKTALGVNPDVKLAEAQEQSYAQQIKIAKGNYYPNLVLFGGIGTGYSNQAKNITGGSIVPGRRDTLGTVDATGQVVSAPIINPVLTPISFSNQLSNNFNKSIGLSLQIPVFNRFTARTSVRKAKLNYENAQLSTQLAKVTLSKTIIQAVMDLNAAVKRYASTQQTYQADKDAFEVIQQRYNVGLVNSLDYNTSLTNYQKAQNDMIEAKYEVVFRSKVIDYYWGNQITL
jgi:outer membrane protein